MIDLGLFTTCVLPGCTTPVVEVGTPCDGCAATGLVRRNPGGHRMTADEIAARDASTRHAHRALALIKDPETRARIHIVDRYDRRPIDLIPNEVYL